MDTIDNIKELAGKLKDALAKHDNAEDKRKAVYELAETLDREQHGKIIVALAASHAAKYGEDYLPEKARTWLQRHEWVRTVAIAILALIAAWGLNSCASSVRQTLPDGTVKERTLIIDGGTASQLIKLYGVPEVPSVRVAK